MKTNDSISARKHRVTGTVLWLMALCVVMAMAITTLQLTCLEREGGTWQAHAPLIALYECGGKAGVAGLFLATCALLAHLARREFSQASQAAS